MEDDTIQALFASQMATVSLSVAILRNLVDRGLMPASEAAEIFRDAASNLPETDGGGWKSVQRATFDKVAKRLELRSQTKAAA